MRNERANLDVRGTTRHNALTDTKVLRNRTCPDMLSKMGGKGSFIVRAIIAVGLFFGFYALALGLAAFLLWLPYAELVYGHRIHFRLTVAAILGAVAIVKGSVFVPAPRFEAPGPEIHESNEPELFALIRSVAGTMKTAMPSQVFLIPDVNAFVTEVGGFMGIGSRRVMGIGLGLLAVDNVSQLQATIAHEFGHYVGGDTRLGGFVYRTRAAIGRVLQTLHGSWISKPFELYAQLFLKVSHSVSRDQELAADNASVAVAGKPAHISGLEQEGRGAIMFRSFMTAEVAPIVSSGFYPENLYEGFRTFSTQVFTNEKLAQLDKALADEETDPYDTHPRLTDRIAYARTLPDSPATEDKRPAISLLADAAAAERKVTRHFADGQTTGKPLQNVAWRDVPTRIYAPKLTEEAENAVRRVSRAFEAGTSITAALRALVVKLSEGDALAVALRLEPQLRDAPASQQAEVAPLIVARTLGILLGASQVESGGTWQSDIGKPHQVLLGQDVHEPFTIAAEAVRNAAKLRELAANLGLLRTSA